MKSLPKYLSSSHNLALQMPETFKYSNEKYKLMSFMVKISA